MNHDALNGLAEYILQVLLHYGFDAAKDKQTLREYLLRRFQDYPGDTELSLRVLFLPRYMDSLKWILFDPSQRELHNRMQAYYADLISTLSDPPEHRQSMQYVHMRLYDLMESAPRNEDGSLRVSEPFDDSVPSAASWDT